jgi:molybdopterin-guanine dinucleotide biosynthesis protein A
VLAGGTSRRFGRDKASEVVGGVPLAERAAATLAEVFEHVVVVSGRAGISGTWRRVPDLRSGSGPLAGLEAALVHAERTALEGVFLLACDLPLVDGATVRAVARALADARAAAPARDGGPGLEPLCAAYRLECLPSVREALERGRLAVHELFSAVGGVTVPLSGEIFLNVNRPADRERAERALADRSA